MSASPRGRLRRSLGPSISKDPFQLVLVNVIGSRCRARRPAGQPDRYGQLAPSARPFRGQSRVAPPPAAAVGQP